MPTISLKQNKNKERNLFWDILDSVGEGKYNWYIRGITTDIPEPKDD